LAAGVPKPWKVTTVTNRQKRELFFLKNR
jgi:hypothetical protein